MPRTPALSVIAIFLIPVFFPSCATLLNGPTQNIRIAADKKIKNISVENALFVDSLAREPHGSGTYSVRRSLAPLSIHAQLDSGEKIIRIWPHNSIAWWVNIENYGAGMLVDRKNPKRYAYRHWNYLTLKDTMIVWRRFAPVPKGTVYGSLSVSLANTFSMRSPQGRSITGGPIGLGLGIDYFYKSDRFLSFSAGAATSAFVDHIGKGYYNVGRTFFGAVRNNLIIGSFDLGYGLSVSDLLWSKFTISDTVNRDRSFRNSGIGFSFSAHYLLGKYLRFGILYQPTLFSIDRSSSFGYQHYLSAGLIWSLPIKQ